jgi:hypothetical protein
MTVTVISGGGVIWGVSFYPPFLLVVEQCATAQDEGQAAMPAVRKSGITIDLVAYLYQSENNQACCSVSHNISTLRFGLWSRWNMKTRDGMANISKNYLHFWSLAHWRELLFRIDPPKLLQVTCTEIIRPIFFRDHSTDHFSKRNSGKLKFSFHLLVSTARFLLQWWDSQQCVVTVLLQGWDIREGARAASASSNAGSIIPQILLPGYSSHMGSTEYSIIALDPKPLKQ